MAPDFLFTYVQSSTVYCQSALRDMTLVATFVSLMTRMNYSLNRYRNTLLMRCDPLKIIYESRTGCWFGREGWHFTVEWYVCLPRNITLLANNRITASWYLYLSSCQQLQQTDQGSVKKRVRFSMALPNGVFSQTGGLSLSTWRTSEIEQVEVVGSSPIRASDISFCMFLFARSFPLDGVSEYAYFSSWQRFQQTDKGSVAQW